MKPHTRIRDALLAIVLGGALGWAAVEFITPAEEVTCEVCI